MSSRTTSSPACRPDGSAVVTEAVVPLGVALIAVTGSVVGLRFLLKDWHRPAAATAAVTVVVFACGHVESALDGNVDERVLFAGAVVLGVAAAVTAIRAGASTPRGTQFLNLMAAVLLAFPVARLAGGIAAPLTRTPTDQTAAVDDVVDRLLPEGLPTVVGDRPDIYYIILDSYPRRDALSDFDNTSFLRELERRVFYVASEEISNYDYSITSISSSLNMLYLDNVGRRTPLTQDDLVNISQYHATGAILKCLGYTYAHLDSGYLSTDQPPLADISISFSPAGTIINQGMEVSRGDSAAPLEPIVTGAFARALVETTALKPVIGHHILSGELTSYGFESPRRLLDMCDFLSSPINVKGSKFVFAHISKPRWPAAFDRHGNYVPHNQGKEHLIIVMIPASLTHSLDS